MHKGISIFSSSVAINRDLISFIKSNRLFIYNLKDNKIISKSQPISRVSSLHFSPKGNKVVLSQEMSPNKSEVYLFDIKENTIHRLSNNGGNSIARGWIDDEVIYFSSNYKQPFIRPSRLYSMNIHSKEIINLNFGFAEDFASNQDYLVISKGYAKLGTKYQYYQNYQGGTKGTLIIINKFMKTKHTLDLNGNIQKPQIIKSTLYFLSDHEGKGNLYAYNLNSKKLIQKTFSTDFYVLDYQIYEEKLCYVTIEGIFLNNLKQDFSKEIMFPEDNSPSDEQEYSLLSYLNSFETQNGGKRLCIISRGVLYIKSFVNESYNYKQITTIGQGRCLGVFYYQNCLYYFIGSDKLYLHYYNLENKSVEEKKHIEGVNPQSIVKIIFSSMENKFCISDKENRICIYNPRDHELNIFDTSEYNIINDQIWSNDGSLIIYSKFTSIHSSSIFVYNIHLNEISQVTTKGYRDRNPHFNLKKSEIIFISNRSLNIIPDEIFFHYNFSQTQEIYVVHFQVNGKVHSTYLKQITKLRANEIRLFFSNNNKLLISIKKDVYSHNEYKLINLNNYEMYQNFTFEIYYVTQNNLIIKQNGKLQLTDLDSSYFNEVDHTIISFISLSDEFKQIIYELTNVVLINHNDLRYSEDKWFDITKKYYQHIDKCNTRIELSELIRNMFGELKNLHLYEETFIPFKMKNFKHYPFELKLIDDKYYISMLDLPNKYNSRILKLFQNYQLVNYNPINSSGHDSIVKLTIIDHQDKFDIEFTPNINPRFQLLNAWIKDNFTFIDSNYPDFGYIYIPDMTTSGYRIFHQQFTKQLDKKVIILDLRFTGGGNISQLIFNTLTKHEIGKVNRRYSKDLSYPSESVTRNLIILINEFTGSDAEILAIAFKQLKSATIKIYGKRTWGGTIGARLRHNFTDKSWIQVPSFLYIFQGQNYENIGLEPDIYLKPDAIEDYDYLREELVKCIVHFSGLLECN